MKKIAWPEGWDPNPILIALHTLSRGNYPFPMYCQKSTIAGLENDKNLGERVLNLNRSDDRSIVLWKLIKLIGFTVSATLKRTWMQITS